MEAPLLPGVTPGRESYPNPNPQLVVVRETGRHGLKLVPPPPEVEPPIEADGLLAEWVIADSVVSHTYLPSPPSDEEKYAFLNRHVGILIGFALISFVGLMVSQFRFVTEEVALLLFLPGLLFTLA